MYAKLISRNSDLKRLQDEGYEIEVRQGYLILHSIPYVNASRTIAKGILVTDLTLNGEQTIRPSNHQVWFAGDFPCKRDGSPILALSHTSDALTLGGNLLVHHRFSCKPAGGYLDHYQKMTRYAEIISNEARAIDPNVSTCTFRPIESANDESVFVYTDSASSRAGITGLSEKLAMNKMAIVGLGGTGAYLLDLVAKTQTKEIHLYDGDDFLQHNAFRAPGAASLEILKSKPSKVGYYASIYQQMHRGITPHCEFIDVSNMQQLGEFDFIFLCVDRPSVRLLLADFLHQRKIPFIDVGMELELIEEQRCLIGTCRTTLSSSEMSDHFSRRVSLTDSPADELYKTNIQVADLNSLNASMAVIRWKKFCGFYQDCYREHQSTYDINTHYLSRDEIPED